MTKRGSINLPNAVTAGRTVRRRGTLQILISKIHKMLTKSFSKREARVLQSRRWRPFTVNLTVQRQQLCDDTLHTVLTYTATVTND